MSVMRVLFLAVFFGLFTPVFACLETWQFKTFPLGFSGNELIALDVNVKRTHALPEKEGVKVPPNETGFFLLHSFISVYDAQGKLLRTEPRDTLTSLADSGYVNNLEQAYRAALREVEKTYPKLTRLTPRHISFCDFQTDCEDLGLRYKQETDSTVSYYLTYKGKEYPVNFPSDQEVNFGWPEAYGYVPQDLRMSSLRIYEGKNASLLVLHLETGDEVRMGYLTADPDKKPENEDDLVIQAHTLRTALSRLARQTGVFEEPLLHHAFGTDVFLILP